MKGKEVKNTFNFGDHHILILFDDGTAVQVKVIAELDSDDLEKLVELLGAKKENDKKEEKKESTEKGKKKEKKDELSWEDLEELDFEELIDLIEEDGLDLEEGNYDEDEDEDKLRGDIAKELDIVVPAKKSKKKKK